MKSFRLFALLSTLATYFLIFVGGLVRVSGAGLGCPDWPKCFGRWIPPVSLNDLPAGLDPTQFNFTLAWIEYINRLVGVSVGILIVVMAVLAIKHYRHVPKILVPSLLAAVLVAFQGWQGSVVVAAELEPLVVSAHLVIALVIVSLLIYVTLQAYYLENGATKHVSGYPKSAVLWMGLLWVATIVQIILGTNVRAGLETLAEKFPLLSDLTRLSRLGASDEIHMILGIALTLFAIFAGITVLKVSEKPSVLVKRTTWMMMGLIVLQVLLGLFLTGIGLTALMQLFHLWIAGLLVGLVFVIYSGLRFSGGLPVESQHSLSAAMISFVAAVLIIGGGAQIVIAQADASRNEIPEYGNVPEFTFTERSGEPFGLEDMKGEINVVCFFFTSCRSICPFMVKESQKLYELYEHSDEVRLVSISVDPENDSLAVLRKYAEDHGATDNRWVFVRADMDEVKKLAAKGFFVSDDFPGGHSIKFILVDREGRIRGYYNYNDPAGMNQLREHIKQVAKSKV